MNWKLTTSLVSKAWWDYPRQRRDLKQMQPGPPIFVSGTHRSGTTWVAKMLAVPGLWYIHEPFNPNKQIWEESFSYIRDASRSTAVDRMMEHLLQGDLRQTSLNGGLEHPLMPLRLMKPPIQRIMIKDPLACLLTGYLTTHFHLQTLVLFRHPCGFVSSVMRLGWPTGGYLQDFLQREELMEDHLEPYRAMMEKYANEDSHASAAVLHGVLNRVLWNTVQSHDLKWYLFEDLCQNPIESFQQIFEWLQLPYSDNVRRTHENLCDGGSADPADYHTHAVSRNSLAMAESWKKQLSESETATVLSIWKEFEIPFYTE